MPNNETLGASFSIDVTQLKAGLAQANRLIRESESEFKAAAAGMDDWRASQDGLEARIKHLNSACDLQQKKVDALQSEYDSLIADGLDPTSAAAVKLRTDINKEKEALAKNESELRKQKQALEELDDAADDAADAVEEAGDAAEDSGDGFTVAKGAVAGFIANGLTALVGAAKDAISSVLGLADATKEYRSTMASLEESSKLAGYSAEETAATYDHLYSVLGDSQTAATTTANLQAIGLEQSKLEEITNGVIGAWAKYGDSIPIDGLSEAVNESIKAGQIAGNLADVVNWGAQENENYGLQLKENIEFEKLSEKQLQKMTEAQRAEYEARKSQYEEIEAWNKSVTEAATAEDRFNLALQQCATEAERADLIMQLFSEQGLTQAAESWQENNQSIIDANNATNEYEKAQAELGETIEPITTKFTELKTQALQWLIDEGLPALQNGFTWIKDNLPTVAGIIGTLTAAWLTFGGAQKIVDGWNKIVAISQGALNAVMNANPIGLVVTAIAGLVTAFVLLWNNCEGFRKFWINLWDGIKNAAKAVGDWFVQAWTSVSNFFSNMWTGFSNGAKSAWQGVKNTFSAVASFFSNIFGNAWAGVKKVFSAGGKVFDGIKDGIVTAFKTVVNALIKGINKVVALPFEGLNTVLKKISKISVAGIKPFSWLTWRAPVPQLPMLAEGGVVRKATTAIIGEDGAEAVVPLEKNTGWIKKLAAEIAAQQPQGVIVNQTNNYSQAHSRIELYKTKQATAAAVRLAMAGA